MHSKLKQKAKSKGNPLKVKKTRLKSSRMALAEEKFKRRLLKNKKNKL